MTVNELIAELQVLSAQGHGESVIVSETKDGLLDSSVKIEPLELEEYWDSYSIVWTTGDCIFIGLSKPLPQSSE